MLKTYFSKNTITLPQTLALPATQLLTRPPVRFPFLARHPSPFRYFAAMSKPVKDAPPAAAEAGVNLPFEEALKRLEGIVESMENDDLPLETLLSKYEEGTKLAQSCQA